MKFKTQKRIAAQILKVSPKRIKFDIEKLNEIKESITKADIRSLINQKIITVLPKRGVSRSRARKRLVQKRKGRRTGQGSRKGKRTARLSRKGNWMIKVRNQRKFLSEIKEKLQKNTYSSLRRKVKSGFFRSRRHIKLYITEHKLIKK